MKVIVSSFIVIVIFTADFNIGSGFMFLMIIASNLLPILLSTTIIFSKNFKSTATLLKHFRLVQSLAMEHVSVVLQSLTQVSWNILPLPQF